MRFWLKVNGDNLKKKQEKRRRRTNANQYAYFSHLCKGDMPGERYSEQNNAVKNED